MLWSRVPGLQHHCPRSERLTVCAFERHCPTTSTAASTLALHDALPIYPRKTSQNNMVMEESETPERLAMYHLRIRTDGLQEKTPRSRFIRLDRACCGPEYRLSNTTVPEVSVSPFAHSKDTVPPPRLQPPLLPYTTLFRSIREKPRRIIW